MNNTFAQLKKNRKSNFDKLNEELEKATGKVEYKNGDDDRFWKPTVDKGGNGFAIIRFLPAPEGEDVPFVRYFDHAFQGATGSWYIENSLTTLGRDDPVSEYNSKLWNSGLESDKDKARKQKRRLHFVSNIYVVEDTAKPENKGKVFLFKYGKKIFDKLYSASNPKYPDQKPFDPFDLWEGANLKLRIKNADGYRNYDDSSFADQSPLAKDDKKMEEIWKQEHSLKEFVDPKNFKPYDELKAKLYRVLGLGDTPAYSGSPMVDGDLGDVVVASKPRSKAPKVEPELLAEVDGDDKDLNFFRSIADEDGEELLA